MHRSKTPYKAWCYLSMTSCLSLTLEVTQFLSFVFYPLSHSLLQLFCLYLSFHLHTQQHTGTEMHFTQEAPSVSEQWSRKCRIPLNSFITRGNVDMASVPNHNNRLPIAFWRKKEKKKNSLKTRSYFSELNVPKHNLIQCSSHREGHRLLIC